MREEKEKRIYDNTNGQDISDLDKLLDQKSRERTRAIADRIVKLLGIALATILFLISFSMLAPLTVFSRLFGVRSRDVWKGSPGLREVFEEGSLYYAFIGPSPVAAIIIMTIIQIILAFLLAFLISLYIKDFIIFLKDILNIGRKITSEIGIGVEEGIKETGIQKNSKDGKNKKKLFNSDEVKTVEEYDVLTEDKPKISKKEEKLLKEIQELGGIEEPEIKKVERRVEEKPIEEPVKIIPVVKPQEVVEEVKTVTEEEINRQIDKILNDQSLTAEQAQIKVTELERQLPNRKKPLFK
jgi:hypothetical protein